MTRKLAFVPVLLTALALGLSFAGVASAQPTLQVIAVKVESGKLADYVQAVKEAQKILDRLETKGTIRVWQAMVAGEATGTVVVGIEYADMGAWANGTAKMNADPEWQKLLVRLGGMRTVLSSSLYQELGK